jgi:hypothetical protein
LWSQVSTSPLPNLARPNICRSRFLPANNCPFTPSSLQ